MILITRRDLHVAGVVQMIAVFGVGLIGSAIVGAIMRSGLDTMADFPLSWTDPFGRASDLVSLAAAMKKLAETQMVRRVEVIWAAGRAGFGASQAEVENELEAFESVMQLCEQLVVELPTARHRLHMTSSAGGLFEGQRFVDCRSTPAPQRPYGELKLQQERRAAQISARIIPLIYRPSSVYGFSVPGGRAGLVTTLIWNAMMYHTSRIFGRLDTVRDYVLANDIGSFVARRIDQLSDKPEYFLLASGRPTAMCEVLDTVRRALGRPLYVKLDTVPSNANDISYRKSALPGAWFPTDLETGIKQVASQLSSLFQAGRIAR